MPQTSSKTNVFRQFKKLDINDNTDENNEKEDLGKTDSTSSCTFPLTFQVDDINKDQSDCGSRSIMGRKRGSYLCKQCTSEKVPVPLKWHICPYKKKYRCVKRDANSKVIEKREVEIQTVEPSFLQQMNESRSKEPKCNKVEK